MQDFRRLEFARFLDISIKSSSEVDYRLELAKEYGLISESEWRTLTAEVVERAGFFAGEAFAAAGRKKAVLVVRDTRASGPSLQKALSDGFRRAGLSVADGGVLPTASAPSG